MTLGVVRGGRLAIPARIRETAAMADLQPESERERIVSERDRLADERDRVADERDPTEEQSLD